MNADELARALGFKRSGNQWVGCCVAHDDRNPSMIIFEGRNGSVQVRCLAGCASIDIIARLQAMGVWSSAPQEEDEDAHERRRRIDTPRATPNRNKMLALHLWDEAVDPRGTPAESYLEGRGLVLPPSAAFSLVRYHPRCPQGDERSPALVALMRNVETFAPQAIQRLFLAENPVTGLWEKTGGMMLGPAGGAAMMITSRHDTFWDDLSFCPHLYVCEGLATGLALHQAGRKPVWALGSANAIRNFPVIFAVGHLVICADHDPIDPKTGLRPGLGAAQRCRERWDATSHQSASIRVPPIEGTDFADWIREGGANGQATATR